MRGGERVLESSEINAPNLLFSRLISEHITKSRDELPKEILTAPVRARHGASP